MEDAAKAKKKAASVKKSCQNCRRSKQRCDIPDRGAIRPGPHPQPKHLSCHRCNILTLDCIVDTPLEEWEKSTLATARLKSSLESRQSPPLSPSSSSPNQYSKRRKTSPGSGSHHPPSTSSSSASTQQQQQQQIPDNKVHVFDPYFSGDGYGDVKANGTQREGNHINSLQHQMSGSLIDIAEKLQSLRPFPYLFRLCSTQPNFLASHISSGTPGQTLGDLLQKYEAYIDWDEMDDQTAAARGSWERGGLYLATRIYLAALRTEDCDLQADLLHYIRSQALSCVLRGPSSVGEASALTALALYEPLLLVSSAEQMQMDGSGLLAAASTASKTLDLERIPLIMQEFDFHSSQDPSSLLRECSLWVTIALISGFNSLAGSFHQRALLECQLESLDHVESFCTALLEFGGHQSPYSELVSRLLLQIFRYQSLRHFQDIIQSRLVALNSLPLSPYDQAQACLVEGLSDTFEAAKTALNKMKILRQTLNINGQTLDMYMDYLEYEVGQLHMFCIINFTEACLLHIATDIGRPIDLLALCQKIASNEQAVGFASAVIGITKSDMAKKLVFSFANFISRWGRQSQQSGGGETTAATTTTTAVQSNYQAANTLNSCSLALPPAFISAMVLSNVKSLADYVGGFIQFGTYPQDSLDDCDSGLTVGLCRLHADDLKRIASWQSKRLFHAKGHRDLYRLASDIGLRTSKSIHEWAATSKGLRAGRGTSFPSSATTSFHKGNSTFGQKLSSLQDLTQHDLANPTKAMQSMRADGQDFERLLEDILSTPIFFS